MDYYGGRAMRPTEPTLKLRHSKTNRGTGNASERLAWPELHTENRGGFAKELGC